MRRSVSRTCVLALLVLAVRVDRSEATDNPVLEEALGSRIKAVLAHPSEPVLGEPLHELDALARFYGERAHRPAWLDRDRTGDRAQALLETVQQAGRHGLRPNAYHADALAPLLRPDKGSGAERLAGIDLLLSDAFLHLARHLASGSIDPRTLHPDYERMGDPPPDAVGALEAALGSGEIAEALARLAPAHPEYAGLLQALERLRAAEAAGDGPPRIADGPLVKPGARDARIVALRARLARPGASRAANRTLFDRSLADALRDFQRRHGLASDGILGPRTIAALNVSAAERADQVRVNLERWRWLPRDFGRRHLRVNTPDFLLRAYDAGEPAQAMRIVVGDVDWTTPLANGVISHLVLNPAWGVPESIATREMLPAVQRDRGYFAAAGIEVLVEDKSGTPRRVDPKRIDWKKVDPDAFPYRLRQPPGPRNPLGRIKFVFPNPHDVYLHGTPADGAFERPARTLSHGCVRVEDELALAAFALAPDPNWTPERLVETLRNASEQEVPLPAPLPVHLLYLTAAADGTPSFTDDPYGWDRTLLAALSAESSS